MYNTRLAAEVGQKSTVLTIVYFEDGKSNELIEVLLRETNSPYLRVEYSIVPQPFSRGKGLKIGLEKSTAAGANTIVWLSDVDMEFSEDFFTRCISTPILNKQVNII